MSFDDNYYVRIAIEIAQRAREKGNHPFGALLVDEHGKILLEAENTVVTLPDITAHAEINLIRQASARFESAYLEKCSIYTSTEPCSMCSGAIFWSNIRRVVYGLSISGLYDLVGWDADDVLNIPCRKVFAQGHKHIDVVGPLLEEEAIKVHAGFWI